MPRQMPKAGYYKWKEPMPGDPSHVEVVYTTGVRGKGGHMYYRVMLGTIWGWCKLQWTCVPSVADMAQDYDYYPELPPGIPAKPESEAT